MNLLAAILVVTNLGFTVAYDTGRRQPVWASYDLEPEEVVTTNRYGISFRGDPRIAGSNMAKQYKAMARSYDRGHLVPAADLNWSTNALQESYYFSNVCPMLSKLNRGKWAENEKEVRELAKGGTVHVLVYPVYGEREKPSEGFLFVPPVKFVKVAWGWFGVKKWEEDNGTK